MGDHEPSGGAATIPLLEVDRTYGGMYAGTSFEFSEAMASHYNGAASRANGVLPGEFVPFSAGVSVSFACPTTPMARADFIAAYNRLRVVVDGELEIHLGDHPHLFSTHPTDPGLIRGVPTYVPISTFPDGFLGRAHTVELFQDDRAIFRPVERFFHTQTSGALFNQIEDAPGAIIVEVRGKLGMLARTGEVVFFTDPVFGEPTGVSQLEDDGEVIPLAWQMLGLDRVGDEPLFHEWVAVGVQPRGERLVLEVRLPNRATGMAAALFSGHSRDTAIRPDATVL